MAADHRTVMGHPRGLFYLAFTEAWAKVNATLMGIAYMSLAVPNTVIGWLGGLYGRMSPGVFWAMHAAIGAGGGLTVALCGRWLNRALQSSHRTAMCSPASSTCTTMML